MPSDQPPPEIVALAERRAVARRGRDWETADALRSQIEEAGWSIVDAGTLYTLQPAVAPDVADGATVRYGSSRSVPSRLDEAPTAVASVVVLATDWPDDLARTLRALVERSPDGTQVIVVANEPSAAQASHLDELDAVDPGAPGVVTEVVWTSTRLGHAAALNAGIRRAAGATVIVMDTGIEPQADIVAPLSDTLADPTVAVAGPFGLVTGDLRRFEEPEGRAGTRDVVAVEGYAMAFRRADYVERGPLDEHFAFYRNLDIWWSLVLRDHWLADAPEPRRAVMLGDLPLIRHEHRGWTSLPDAERDRLSKRNFYRVLKQFATRRDLLLQR